MADVDPIPEGYPQVTPYLHVDGANAAIDFYGKVLGAQERFRMDGPEGTIGHAELQLGDSIIMVSDEFPDRDVRGPKSVGGTPVTISVYVEDVDSVFETALAEALADPVVEGRVERGLGGLFARPRRQAAADRLERERVIPHERRGL
ncbi:MAG TPA: VOC family protein, partial [Thermoleophilaceae bacterium]|nr:VOC family protein [Thermoleophilaceae bacterium]